VIGNWINNHGKGCNLVLSHLVDDRMAYNPRNNTHLTENDRVKLLSSTDSSELDWIALALNAGVKAWTHKLCPPALDIKPYVPHCFKTV
jgi:hypothetical protein